MSNTKITFVVIPLEFRRKVSQFYQHSEFQNARNWFQLNAHTHTAHNIEIAVGDCGSVDKN